MTAWKSILVGILSFLLLFSISIFGISFMVNSTAMNPDFISGLVEEADITQLANDFAEEELIDEIPEDIPFLEDVIYDVIADHEPWLKEQFSAAVHDGYDYLLDKTENLEIRIPLESLKESVRESAWRHFMERLPEWISGPDDEGLKGLIYDNIYEFAGELPGIYIPDDYSMLSEAQLRQYVDMYFQDIESQIVDSQLSPSLKAQIEDLLLPYFNEYYDELVEEIPAEFVVNEDEISSDTMETLETAKQWVGVFKTVFYALIGFMVLLIAGIVLIYRNVKDSTRSLSITFLVYGVVEFAAVMVALYLVPNYFPIDDWPVSIQNFITDAYSRVLAPLQWFSLGILIAGVALLLTSIFYRRGKATEEED
jgi:hypothetical protein